MWKKKQSVCQVWWHRPLTLALNRQRAGDPLWIQGHFGLESKFHYMVRQQSVQNWVDSCYQVLEKEQGSTVDDAWVDPVA